MYAVKASLHALIQRFKVIFLGLVRPRLKVGRGAVFGRGTYIGKGRDITIGERFFCGIRCHLSCPAKIGNDVMFASKVALVGGDHKIDFIDVPMNQSGRDVMKTIVIEDNVWIGHGAIIMHGVTIEAGAVVAAGSVVTKDVQSNAIVGGNPARFIRLRKF